MNYSKLCVFDLDGVLIDSRMIHYHALNDALESNVGREFTISMDEHLSTYDGLSTTKKLEMLAENRGLNPERFNDIWKAKQQATVKWYTTLIQPSEKIKGFFKELKENNIRIAVASNSIRETLEVALHRLDVIGLVDYYVSNEDVNHPKPNPEMYWKCMTELGAIPRTTVIIEDSHIGRQGATDSGAHMIPVENINDLTSEKISEALFILNGGLQKSIPWRDMKLNVLIPMAGLGSRFAKVGYTFPKPLIDVKGKPMVQVVHDNLNIEANYIFITQKDHYESYNLQYLLNVIAPGCKIVQTDGLTQGAACTTLLAHDLINNENPLLIANSDQFLEWNSNEVMYAFQADTIDAGIVTFKNTHPKFSYARLGDDGFVAEIAEKKVISDHATTGHYWYRHGYDYVQSAKLMIEKNIRTNNEFYVAPVLNQLIQNGGKVRLKEIEKFWSLGDPESLQTFLQDYKGRV